MTLRELLERERDRAAEALVESFWGPRDSLEEEEQTSFDVEKSQYRHGFNHVIKLLMPVVEAIKTSIVVDHNCEECGTFTSVCYEISELKKVIKELEAKLGEA